MKPDPERSLQLNLIANGERDKTIAYDEQPPTCICYLIEWKVKLKNRCISKNTEPVVVLAPGAYWTKFLWSKLDKLSTFIVKKQHEQSHAQAILVLFLYS
ncbi:3-(3-hydroxy-phenyl)propionate/3-hydroxycinnamic acid hydroxylase 2 [Fusarium oxysporum f. sp. albedinis]|nr:3-(3-hydroxy-phenyl)propionate/3-hydroxycinnamic acid hydroxylase 2 [Fusarium oxysporum f. sp. albedinis]